MRLRLFKRGATSCREFETTMEMKRDRELNEFPRWSIGMETRVFIYIYVLSTRSPIDSKTTRPRRRLREGWINHRLEANDQLVLNVYWLEIDSSDES